MTAKTFGGAWSENHLLPQSVALGEITVPTAKRSIKLIAHQYEVRLIKPMLLYCMFCGMKVNC